MARNFSRSRTPFVGQRARKRESIWFFATPTEVTITTTGGIIFFSLNAAALALRPFTVVRSIFEMYIRSDQEAAAEIQGCAVGLAVVSDQAVAIGVTAVPTPITDMGSDLWYGYKLITSSSSSGTGSAVSGRSEVLDSKAMRKVEDGQDMIAKNQILSRFLAL